MSLKQQQLELLNRSLDQFLMKSPSSIEKPFKAMSINAWLSSDEVKQQLTSSSADNIESNKCQLMAPVLESRPLSYWLAASNQLNYVQSSINQPINDRVPANPDVSMWLANNSNMSADESRLLDNKTKNNIISNSETTYCIARAYAKRRAELEQFQWVISDAPNAEVVQGVSNENVKALAKAYLERKAQLDSMNWVAPKEKSEDLIKSAMDSMWLSSASLSGSVSSSMSSSTMSVEDEEDKNLWIANPEQKVGEQDQSCLNKWVWNTNKDEASSRMESPMKDWILFSEDQSKWIQDSTSGKEENLWIVQGADEDKEDTLEENEDFADDFTDTSSIAIISEDQDDITEGFETIEEEEASQWLAY